MGYTHYWKIPKGIDDSTWDRIRDVSLRVLEHPEAPRLHGRSEFNMFFSMPEVTDKYILFNGYGKDGCGQFHLSKDPSSFGSCRTDRKPYDRVVTAILIAAQNLAPARIQVSSDGDAEDWFDGLELLNRAAPEGNPAIGRWMIPLNVVDPKGEL